MQFSKNSVSSDVLRPLAPGDARGALQQCAVSGHDRWTTQLQVPQHRRLATITSNQPAR
jgi:hypothetical protein